MRRAAGRKEEWVRWRPPDMYLGQGQEEHLQHSLVPGTAVDQRKLDLEPGAVQ